MKVHVLTISHRYGTNLYACANAKLVHKELVKFVEEWWDELNYEEDKPTDEDEMIDIYFENHEGVEWYETDVVDLIEE